jgi:hypothetical protein
VLRRLDLHNVERFAVTFRDDPFLVGPNNAGKSTIIAALRACAAMPPGQAPPARLNEVFVLNGSGADQFHRRRSPPAPISG